MTTNFALADKDPEALRYIHAQASWFILDCKYLYYVRDASPVPDKTYDQIEKLYEALCVHFGEPPTATDMVGFSYDRPSCALVATRLDTADPSIVLSKSETLMEYVQALGEVPQ